MRLLQSGLCALVVVLVLAGTAGAAALTPTSREKTTTGLARPTALRAFLPPNVGVRQNSGTPTFARTPAFAWKPARGAARYELVLSTSVLSRENSIIWRDATLTTPVAAVPVALPWVTNALVARVRAIGANGAVGPWSAPYTFGVRWNEEPSKLESPNGLVRWNPVAGATSYQVWYVNAPGIQPDIFSTIANVADEREFYGSGLGLAPSDPVRWRVRAVRKIYGSLVNGMSAVSYGPWSPVYTNFNNKPFVPEAVAISDRHDGRSSDKAHESMPGFSWDTSSAGSAGLHRVYVFTDGDCVNNVFDGVPVSGPAYAPRSTPGPFGVFAGENVEREPVLARELQPAATFAPAATGPAETSPASGSTGTSASATGVVDTSALQGSGAPIGLWDGDLPSPLYHWTTVAVSPGLIDTDVPQDICDDTSRSGTFRIASQLPAVNAETRTPFVWGLSAAGSLVSATPKQRTFYGRPLIAWGALGQADAYEVEWSRSTYPGRPAQTLYTFSSVTTLPLTPGTWYYRVRGINMSLPTGASAMGWSQWVRIVIAKPKFQLVPGK